MQVKLIAWPVYHRRFQSHNQGKDTSFRLGRPPGHPPSISQARHDNHCTVSRGRRRRGRRRISSKARAGEYWFAATASQPRRGNGSHCMHSEKTHLMLISTIIIPDLNFRPLPKRRNKSCALGTTATCSGPHLFLSPRLLSMFTNTRALNM